jgi:hypothetical protein
MRTSLRRYTRVVLGLLLLGFEPGGPGNPGTASATVLVQLTLSEMAARSAHVLVGTVEQQRSLLLPGQGVIVTDVTIRCTRGMRGVREGQLLTVRHFGGTVDGIGQRVFGEASYRVGEEVLLMAEERNGSYFAVGMAQGAMHIDRSSGTPRVHVQMDGVELLSPSGQLAARPTAEGVPLDQVLAQIESLLARTPAPGGR